MSEIQSKDDRQAHETSIVEDYEPLTELRAAFERRDTVAYEGILAEICSDSPTNIALK